MLRLTSNPAIVDRIVNHPAVRPTIQAGTERLHSRGLLERKGVICYVDEDETAAALFVPTGPQALEGHICALPTSRGAKVLGFGAAALLAVRQRSSARFLVAQVPMPLRAARFLCRRLGFTAQPRDLADMADNVERFVMEI